MNFLPTVANTPLPPLDATLIESLNIIIILFTLFLHVYHSLNVFVLSYYFPIIFFAVEAYLGALSSVMEEVSSDRGRDHEKVREKQGMGKL